MTQINIIAIGKLQANDPEQQLIGNYLKRLRWKTNLVSFESKIKDAAQSNKEENEFILSKLSSLPGFNIILDEKGKHFTSLEFAKLISNSFNNHNHINFVIGGADGLTQATKLRANEGICLGKLTWPHKLARVMLAEQLYRSYSIIQNHPYHREG
ncbi:23S rRNA (pseudouridine(1915)-N(3))-methyltransferase RlmH [Rickettsiales endosymbiont of Stachyamoeba lipophora]|uniref:23S rRNA (pseudouridine(1915)-N(3))-methyltransferase RlmH n=1 Tax=Rickettsiales endosymbiont of Stachyamoeba lipophora TaxID=2486578 RepID=UPI000F64AE15|nr:23S rRNA (pseudouridine(1915)-N(3))-methyltransferase RlmH [Rickettsiales endosymbiont of Stachyamoeba lipophora]AZL16424.1 23S rRNA (pseudouridine(1915)-N(3))-methyltransferase RlmH [Rickettsiales endosymbiont of Stachyamoeba lipophora]